jgi:hypothetical protein
MAFHDRVDAGRQVRHALGHPRDSDLLARGGLRGRPGRRSRAPAIADWGRGGQLTQLPRGPPGCHCPGVPPASVDDRRGRLPQPYVSGAGALAGEAGETGLALAITRIG